MTTTRDQLEALLLDAAGPDRFVDRQDAIDAGIPARFLDTVRRQSVLVMDAADAKQTAQSIAESIDQYRTQHQTTDPAELAKLIGRG